MDELKLPDNLLQFCDIPFKLVPHSFRVWLGLHLNPERGSFAPTTSNLQDWRGVAEVLEFSALEIQNFQRFTDPMGEVLKNMKIAKQDATVGNVLWSILQCERNDILENPKLVEFLQKVKPSEVQDEIEKKIQDPNVDSCSDEQGCLTVGEADTGIPEYFNAFVCCSPVDLPFVKNMTEELEGKQHLKLLIPERDFLPGPSKYLGITKMIRERCDKFIVVLSPDFMKSEECGFMLSFAHSLNPNAVRRRVIPVVYKQCEIPAILIPVTAVDYTRVDVIEWFWDRLIKSIKAPNFLSNSSAHPASNQSDQASPRSQFQDTVRLKTRKNQDDFLEVQYDQMSTSHNDDRPCGVAREPSPTEDFIDVSMEIPEMARNPVTRILPFSFTQMFKSKDSQYTRRTE